MTEEEFDPTGLLPLLDDEVRIDDVRPIGDAMLENQRRLDVETLGWLALDLEPVAPRAGARERLLARIATVEREGDPAPRIAVPAGHSSSPTAASTVVTPNSQWRLAAALVLGVLGLAAAGWSYYERGRFEDELARVHREHESLIATLHEREQQLSAEKEARQGEVGRRNQALQLVSSRGVEVCPLRPVGVATTLQPDAFAVLYMAPAQNSWYVKASQLAPAPAGRIYRVWFETADGSVLAGDLRPAPDFDLQFEAATFRALAMKGVKITLEPAGAGPEPSGPSVLFGADKMTVL